VTDKKNIAKHAVCIWNPDEKKWNVEITLSDGSSRVVEFKRSHRTSMKKMVKDALEKEQLIPAWDMKYSWFK